MTPESLVRVTRTLFSLPGVVMRVNELIDNPATQISDLAEVILCDPALSARLLRLVNSAYSGRPQRVDSIPQAITLIGQLGLRDLILATAVVSLFKGLPPEQVNMEQFWFHSIACGIAARELAWVRLIRRDDELASRAEILGLWVAALWLLHPLNVSTVLYIVQRMAQLSAFFSLLAMWSYLNGREKIEAGNAKIGVMWIFLAVPVFTMLAALSKENGLLIPIYCGVIELLMFRTARPRAVLLFQFGFVFAPIAISVAALVAFPNWLLAGYSQREWGLMERILTQFRVLWDYIGPWKSSPATCA